MELIPKIMEKIRFSKEVTDFLQGFGKIHNTGTSSFIYMPYWFKDLGNNVFERIPFEQLPEELVKSLQEEREVIKPRPKEYLKTKV